MTFVESIQVCFAKYADFSGRASRSEYWFFNLFVVLGYVGCLAAGQVLDPMVVAIFGVAVLLPGLAVTVRRLHDTDRSGWFYLLNFIPLINLVLLVFMCLRGTEGANRFGADPLGLGPSEPTAPGATKPGV